MTGDSKLAFVGTYTDADEDGLFGFRVDGEGKLHRTGVAAGGADPAFFAPDSESDHLYVASRQETDGYVVAYAIDRETGTLSRLNAASTKSNGAPCYCSVDATDRCVLTAQYDDGTVSVLPIDNDGRISEPTTVIEHEGSGLEADRQSEPHPHSIRPGPDNEYAYAPDLGADRVFVYSLDSEKGTLEPADCGHVDVHAGAGPRHLDFHPDGRCAYLINELDSTVTAFRRDTESGALDALTTVPTLPDSFAGENYTADIHVHPSGDYLYGSNRGHDTIAIYELDAHGRPSLITTEGTHGKRPRNFAIDPAGVFLFVENKDTNNIVTFQIEDNGDLTPTGHVTDIPTPTCMRFAGE